MGTGLPYSHSLSYLPSPGDFREIKLVVKRGVDVAPDPTALLSCSQRPGQVMAREGAGGPSHSFSLPQKITDNIKGKVCSLAVCAVAWLVAHVRMLGLDEREKSLQMIRQLAGPLYSENTLQFYNERSAARPLPSPALRVCREKSAPPVTTLPPLLSPSFGKSSVYLFRLH